MSFGLPLYILHADIILSTAELFNESKLCRLARNNSSTKLPKHTASKYNYFRLRRERKDCNFKTNRYEAPKRSETPSRHSRVCTSVLIAFSINQATHCIFRTCDTTDHLDRVNLLSHILSPMPSTPSFLAIHPQILLTLRILFHLCSPKGASSKGVMMRLP